jgi:acyl-CoA hydrolase
VLGVLRVREAHVDFWLGTLMCGGMNRDVPALPPAYARVSLAIITSGREANLLGNVHGGEIMKLADSTAGAVAQRHSGGPAVTAAMDEMAFLAPVHVGDLVRTFAQVNWAGRSSMEIGVRVEAQPWNDPSQQALHVASAYFVFVAIDADGRSREVPGLLPETPDEVRRMREAEIRRAHRLAKKQEIETGRRATR